MATTALAFDNTFDVTDAGQFIPEVWSDDIIATYKRNKVMANLVSRIDHKGKKGSVIHIPNPARGAATAKSANTVVTLVTTSGSDIDVTINKHYNYSFLIEDIVEVQALSSLRSFYTDDAGEALATQVDTDLINLAASWNGSTAYSNAFIGGDGVTEYDTTSAGNGSAITDAGIRAAIQKLDDLNVPGMNRSFVIPPVTKKTMLGLARFTEQAFTGEAGAGNSIRTGLVGNVYGVDVYVSSNCATVVAADTTTNYRAALLFHKGVSVLAEQMAVRVESQRKLEALGTLVVADTIYGVANLRAGAATSAGVALIVPA